MTFDWRHVRLSQLLNDYMKKNGNLSSREIADRTGLGERTIARIKRLELDKISLKSFFTIIDALGFDYKDVLENPLKESQKAASEVVKCQE